MSKFFSVTHLITVAIVAVGLSLAVKPAVAADNSVESWLNKQEATLSEKIATSLPKAVISAGEAVVPVVAETAKSFGFVVKAGKPQSF